MWPKGLFRPLPPALWHFAGPLLFLPVLQGLLLHRLGLSWADSIQDAVVSGALLMLAALETALLFHYYQPGRDSPGYRGVILLASVALLVWILSQLPGTLLPDSPEYRDFLNRSLPVRGLFALLILFFISLLTWIRNQLIQKQEWERRKVEGDTIRKEAELSRLRQQLHPHFLFNSLNSIHALIGTQPEAARRMTVQLSDFLRGTLREENVLISLREELAHLDLYLGIEQVRFGNRLSVERTSEPQSLEVKLPALLLQPVVENAIKFGLYERLGEVKIFIRTRLVPGFLEVEVENPFDADARPPAGTGFGLHSIERRLHLLFARSDLMETHADFGKFRTTIRIPLQHESNSH